MSHKPLSSNDFEQTGLVAQRSSIRIRFQYPTGYQLGYSVERLSDGLLYDFSTSTFVTTPATLINPIAEDTGSFLGRYKDTLTPTPVAQFTDGHYCVTVHDTVTKQVVAELATTMSNGDDMPSLDMLMASLQQVLAAVQAPRPLVFGSPIYPAH